MDRNSQLRAVKRGDRAEDGLFTAAYYHGAFQDYNHRLRVRNAITTCDTSGFPADMVCNIMTHIIELKDEEIKAKDKMIEQLLERAMATWLPDDIRKFMGERMPEMFLKHFEHELTDEKIQASIDEVRNGMLNSWKDRGDGHIAQYHFDHVLKM